MHTLLTIDNHICILFYVTTLLIDAQFGHYSPFFSHCLSTFKVKKIEKMTAMVSEIATTIYSMLTPKELVKSVIVFFNIIEG